MKILFNIILGILVFLAVSSGVTKILLMQQDVDFFGKYGFTSPILMAFGAAQLLGGVFMIFRKTRSTGALVVIVTFLVSLVMLLMDGNIPVSIVTAIATVLLGWVLLRSKAGNTQES